MTFTAIAYEFFRNKNLNAKGFFDSSKLDYLQNQFGATLGGPIKKDRLSFLSLMRGTASGEEHRPTPSRCDSTRARR